MAEPIRFQREDGICGVGRGYGEVWGDLDGS